MAIYHLTAKTGSRGGGQSAGAKCDYVCREGKYSKRADELVMSDSGHMPEWAIECPRMYWQAADQHERANGRLFKELEFALPRELGQEDACALALQFSEYITQSEHLPYTMAVHRGANPDDLHCHLVVSERVNDGHSRSADVWFKRANSKDPVKGGAKKTTALMPKEWLNQTRADWQDMANTALKRAGRAERIDHRSYKVQGLDRFPEPKLGPSVVNMERKGIRTQYGTEAIQRASVEAHRSYLKQQEVAFERRRNSQGQNAGRAAGRSNPERGGHGDVSGQYVASAPADRRECGWFEAFIRRFRKPKPIRKQDGKSLETARLETLGRYVDRGGRRVVAGPRLLEAWGRDLKRALDRFRNHECREAVERHNEALLEADRRRQAESERAARLEKQRLEAAEKARLKDQLHRLPKAELKKFYRHWGVRSGPYGDSTAEARKIAGQKRDAAVEVWNERGFHKNQKAQSRSRGPSRGGGMGM